MNRKMTEERFGEMKAYLSTPVRIYPSVRMTALQFGCSAATVSLVKNSKDFEEYKKKRTRISSRRGKIYIPAPMSLRERENAKREIEEFNNEWFFQ
jgi:hypothetical protein